MALPATQKAIVIQGPGVAKLVADRPIPKLRDDYILVKTVAVGLNPTDWKHVDFIIKEAGPLLGCDYAGVVEAVGPKVTKPLKKGDRVCGFVHGANFAQHEDGTFAEYIVAKGDIQIKIPDSLSFEDAATLGVSVTAVGQSLYQKLGLKLPSEPVTDATPILIYGGSTASGMLAIQYAKLSGYKVITTCSPRHNDLVRSLGADAVFDYRDPECAAKMRAYTDDSLALVFDPVSLPASAEICEAALASRPPPGATLRYQSLLAFATSRSDVTYTQSVTYTAIGEELIFPALSMPASEEDYRFAVEFWELTRGLLEAGKLKTAPVQLGQGLEGVLDGLQAMREKKVSGKKLVNKL
ncbi:Alcohol dehydrogenase superfamily, zinc-type [Metarhizium album ARSEF 1941]|uniref:Alcohol dehydrogenase superfamily, zinc-type n=1 Tax=Metarhizium album (strain ARSEF 1941) TaxID=1081103 RepID=A0A0B2WRL0_METAS|nr:Alcohol dehydrogenase superfamily, zinc-type [Metarhizium album ARSEF 1941]KHN96137.1 Alcohol dehydrogenase superfamily, zinc-type [Metarhizium album ARSEF 1941]